MRYLILAAALVASPAIAQETPVFSLPDGVSMKITRSAQPGAGGTNVPFAVWDKNAGRTAFEMSWDSKVIGPLVVHGSTGALLVLGKDSSITTMSEIDVTAKLVCGQREPRGRATIFCIEGGN